MSKKDTTPGLDGPPHNSTLLATAGEGSRTSRNRGAKQSKDIIESGSDPLQIHQPLLAALALLAEGIPVGGEDAHGPIEGSKSGTADWSDMPLHIRAGLESLARLARMETSDSSELTVDEVNTKQDVSQSTVEDVLKSIKKGVARDAVKQRGLSFLLENLEGGEVSWVIIEAKRRQYVTLATEFFGVTEEEAAREFDSRQAAFKAASQHTPVEECLSEGPANTPTLPTFEEAKKLTRSLLSGEFGLRAEYADLVFERDIRPGLNAVRQSIPRYNGKNAIAFYQDNWSDKLRAGLVHRQEIEQHDPALIHAVIDGARGKARGNESTPADHYPHNYPPARAAEPEISDREKKRKAGWRRAKARPKPTDNTHPS